MATLTPVNFDPFAQVPKTGAGNLVPVDYDPFSTPDTTTDVVKQSMYGLGEGTKQLFQGVGPVAQETLGQVANLPQMQGNADAVKASGRFLADVATPAPLKAATRVDELVKNLTRSVTGNEVKAEAPQTPLGGYARTIGEFLPSTLVGGARSVGQAGMNALKFGVIPAVAGETAEQSLDANSPFKPYAKGAAALATGVGMSMLPNKIKSTAPTVEQLRGDATVKYKEAENAGVVMTPKAYKDVADDIVQTVKKEGYDPKIHPKNNAAIDRLEELNGKPVTFQELETLRKIAKGAGKSLGDDEARISQIIVNKIDDLIENIQPSQMIKGDAVGAKTIVEARDLWSKVKKTEAVDELIENAKLRSSQFSGSGFENALRTEFRNFVRNEKNLRGFSKEEVDALRKVATGGPLENVMRFFGKFSPTGGLVPTVLGGGLGFTVGGSLPAALATLGGAAAARRTATQMTDRNAQIAQELMRGGRPTDKQPGMLAIINALMAGRQ